MGRLLLVLNVLVTGGNGFIGTHVTRLLRQSYNVKVLDIPRPDGAHPGFIAGNVMNLRDLVSATEDCDVVVHMAGVVGVEKSEANPIGTLDVNVLGTRNVLEACRINHVGKIIFSSSSEIYGEALESPVEESATPMPITVYGVSKLAAEEYVKSFSKEYGMRFTILRFFNAYGPGQATDFVIPRFIDLVARGDPISIHGNGSQIRSFCHIKDISKSIPLAIQSGDNEVLNIGNDTEPITIRKLAEKIISVSNSKSTLKYLSFKDSGRRQRKEILKRIPAIGKARRILGYAPSITLEDGLRGMVEESGLHG